MPLLHFFHRTNEFYKLLLNKKRAIYCLHLLSKSLPRIGLSFRWLHRVQLKSIATNACILSRSRSAYNCFRSRWSSVNNGERVSWWSALYRSDSMTIASVVPKLKLSNMQTDRQINTQQHRNCHNALLQKVAATLFRHEIFYRTDSMIQPDFQTNKFSDLATIYFWRFEPIKTTN